MKGNVFSIWIKEFCALVFTQSVQAFLIAVILILVAESVSLSNGYTTLETNNAAGVLAIIALTSISKMEMLIKKILGIESSVTDSSMSGGKGGILGTVIALKMLKRVTDNIPKMAAGVGGVVSAGAQRKKLNLAENKEKLNQYRKFNELHEGANSPSGGAGAGAGGAGAGGAGAGGAGNGNGAGAGAGGAGYNNSYAPGKDYIKDKHALEDNLEKIKADYEQKRKDLNKQSRESIKKIISGITESTGAVMGAATGAVVGAGTGDDILRTAATGMGVGDMIGKGAVDISSSLVEKSIETSKLHKSIKGYNKKMADYRRQIEIEQRKINAGDL